MKGMCHMTNEAEFQQFIEQLLERAVAEFKETEEYQLLKEQLAQMDRTCETMFTKEEKDFAEDCFALILSVDGQQEQYVYQQGLKDCIWLLKRLGVLE